MLYVQYMAHSNGYLHIHILLYSVLFYYTVHVQELNKKVIQNKLLQEICIELNWQHVKVCRPYIN